MANSNAVTARAESASCGRGNSLWSNRWLWLALGAATLIGGAALNWSWLVAAGALPVLFAALPCVAMCALHLCMRNNGKGESQNAKPST
jgi:hypothetical protein